MALEKITRIQGKGVYIQGDDIDTDRIIPARYMKVVTFDGLGEFMFRDVRFDAVGNPTDHVLNDPRYAEATIMLVDRNFGCGSSREHAPQAIRRAGFKAIIGESFAEIFYGNSVTLGMPCIEATTEQIREMAAAVAADPDTLIDLDIAAETVTVNGKTYQVSVKKTAKDALVNGMWDPIAELLENSDAIEATAQSLPYV
jgi:3-isopropylmalate/(R)-2-methylmalate dehydratase small subunit